MASLAKANREPELRNCSNCGLNETLSVELHPCSRCKVALYCGTDCQTTHWKKGGHKGECKSHTAAGSMEEDGPDGGEAEIEKQDACTLSQAMSWSSTGS